MRAMRRQPLTPSGHFPQTLLQQLLRSGDVTLRRSDVSDGQPKRESFIELRVREKNFA